MHNKKGNDVDYFNAIAISVASPEQMLSWSHGEVKKPETINYRTQKPERDGLFCEKIFGPTKNWECYCGKYKRIRYKGVICEKCGVEVTRSAVRRERMAHIKLAVPVTHIWFLRSTPSRIGLLLDLPVKTIEQVVYFASYIVTEIDNDSKLEAMEQLKGEYAKFKKGLQTEFKEQEAEIKKADLTDAKKKKQLEKLETEKVGKIEELAEQNQTAKEDLANLSVGSVISELQYRDLSMKFGHIFKAGIGAEAIREIIENMKYEEKIKELNVDLKKATGQKKKKLIKRTKLMSSLLKRDIKPEWMVLSVLPVIPPDLRPMVQLDGGRFAASDLNDLYRRVINRNNRLKRLIAIGAPEVICRNEKRMLQEAVDTLLNNSARQGKTVFSSGDKRKLRSLSDMLKGKQGRFRQNLLGKRVDYSGRSVIVVGPHLKLDNCGLPKTMALELFKPFVTGRLIDDGYAHNIKSAEKLITQQKKEVWDILEQVTRDRYVLLNRAPTLHRLGIQAFKPVLIEGKAIQIHPLVCAAFNADFDGDQMAVHVPLSAAAQKEAGELIASSANLLKPSAGDAIVTPSQDMIMGCYYITSMFEGKKGEGMAFADEKDALLAYENGFVHLQAIVKVRINGEIVETSVGRIKFNQALPEEYPYTNSTFKKKHFSNIIREVYANYGIKEAAQMADRFKDIGFEFATLSGLTISTKDMIIPKVKDEIIEESSEKVRKINNLYWKGLVSDEERYVNTIKVWNQAKANISKELMGVYEKENDIYYMVDSGARGNWGQITQLCGMKGLVANPAGKTIEIPVKSNLKEGFNILEYFIATHGGRKGKSDTALKTAEAGYLTRRLVDAVQDIIIKDVDCGTKAVHVVTRQESEEIGEEFENRIFGRVLSETVKDTKTGKVIAKKGAEIDHNTLDKISAGDVEQVTIRSVINCQTINGICQKCYGRDLGLNKPIAIGTAVGIIAAQSIGEPGTQLTMRTFHMGGVAEGSDITQGLTRVEELFEARAPKTPALLSDVSGLAKVKHKGKITEVHIATDEPVEKGYAIEGLKAKVKKGDKVKANEVLAEEKDGKVHVEADEDCTVLSVKKSQITVKTDNPATKVYKVPRSKTLKVKSGDLVAPGQALTIGHINLRELLKLTDIYTVQKYIITEVQSIYTSQGQTINDKHLETIARQMLSKIKVSEPGDAKLLPGEIINVQEFEHLRKEAKELKKTPPEGERLLLGLTRIALHTHSWLSAASFQETIRVLVEASTTKKVDYLTGLKENVIIGKLIPAGKIYQKMVGMEEEAVEPAK